MKKTMVILSLALSIAIMGCNEKKLVSDITGDWHMSKYMVDGRDKTLGFDTTHTGFKWRFTADGKYYKSWTETHIGQVYTVDSIQHYDSTSMTLVFDSTITTSAIVPFVYHSEVRGAWVLINGNKYLQTNDSLDAVQYEIKDHSTKNLHLYSGSEDIYLAQ
ncbi:MAG: hypothetical protein JST83_13695 [Bacteroidetes bacterium]|nr:hypothetical protein [Bacteroidota bacterium]